LSAVHKRKMTGRPLKVRRITRPWFRFAVLQPAIK
jgi:hypothetical protein